MVFTEFSPFLNFSFNLPAIPESFNARKGNSELRKDHIIYKLKKHQRIIQVLIRLSFADLKEMSLFFTSFIYLKFISM